MFTWIYRFFTDLEFFLDAMMLGTRHRTGLRTAWRVALYAGLSILVRYYGSEAAMTIKDAIEAAVPGFALGIGSQPPRKRETPNG